MASTDLNRRTALQLLLAGGSAALLAGCAGTPGAPPPSGPSTNGTNGGSRTISVTDQRGKTLTFARPVTRVVTIPMPAASLLVAVDRTADHLAAMHNASWVAMRDGIMGTIFPKALELPHEIATQDFTANVESVRALDPDVVIQWSDAQLIDPLEKAGLNVIGLTNTGKQEDVDAWVAMFAAMLGKPERAADIKARSDADLAAVKDLAAGRGSTRPSILYFNRFTGGLKVAAANSYNDFYIKLVGGTNPATGNDPLKGSGMVGLDVEQVLRWDPEIILLGNFDNAVPQDLYSNPVWQPVSAVRNRRVYKVPLGGYRWDPPGQESPLMWHWLSDIAFPRQQSLLRNKVVEYFDFLYGHKPTAAELDKILWTTANAGSDHYGQFNAA
ncbi:ABC transporter substrate-binding protein [Pseudarthrobacter sp. H3Y2-7]|jgi:iron complex transport system substrate-binding protein|uniref:ABC transporter substrate-binding protein n=1 Tax=Pseudarthrobacter naphthalenicus TaxID=3031328 RepID=UPI0023AFE8A1|nr:ABC transporter substrate-binding protein [Pseudarthrobacter sp. H3Y2-7]MDE8669342.1 ABC transporter substrate-binding protein [Pseudarthrobacter sp. H3Y2-7]